MPPSVEVKYAIPGRQMAFIMSMVFLLPAVAIAAGVLLDSIVGIFTVILIGLAAMIWGIWRGTSGLGTLQLEEDALLITPSRSSICTPTGPLRLGWSEIVSVSVVDAGMSPRLYTQLRTETRPRDLVIVARRAGEDRIGHRIAERAEAWRKTHPEAPPIRRLDPLSGPFWQGVAVLGVTAFILLLFAVFYYGKAGDWTAWARLLVFASFVLPLAGRVFSWGRRGRGGGGLAS